MSLNNIGSILGGASGGNLGSGGSTKRKASPNDTGGRKKKDSQQIYEPKEPEKLTPRSKKKLKDSIVDQTAPLINNKQGSGILKPTFTSPTTGHISGAKKGFEMIKEEDMEGDEVADNSGGGGGLKGIGASINMLSKFSPSPMAVKG
jgi:hypothetical protein